MKKFSIHPVGLIVWFWLIVVLGPIVAMNYFFAILLHELGHFLVAKRLGYQLNKFSLSPYGAELCYYGQNLDFKDELKIAFAGPCVNLLSAFFIFSIWWIFPTIYFFTESFVSISLLLALFNLLPAYPLDGGRIFVCLSSFFFKEKTAKKITVIFNLVLAIGFLMLFVVCTYFNFNPSLFLFAIFLFAGMLDLKFVSRYEKINIFNKKTKNFAKPVFCCVNGDTTLKQLIEKIQSSKTHIFCLVLENGRVINLSEKMVINLSLKYFYETKLKEIFAK